MDKKLITLSWILLSTLALSGCNFFNKNNGGDQKPTPTPFVREYDYDQKAEDGNYTVNTVDSIVNWEVRDSKNKLYNGTVNIKTGEANIEDGKFKSANIVLDMSALKIEGDNPAIENFIKSNEYLDVTTYPEIKLEIPEVKEIPVSPNDRLNYEVKAKANVKGQSDDLNFDAEIVEISDNVIKFVAEVDLDMKAFGADQSKSPESVKLNFELNPDIRFEKK